MTARTSLAVLTAIGLAALPAAAFAAPAVALVGDKTLVSFDTETGAAGASVEVTGVDSLLGIDVRPADSALYGVAADGSVVTIDLATGAATAKSMLSEKLPDGVSASVDFNPVADRLRLVGSDGTNLRANVDDGMTTVDGKLNFDAADANAAATSSVVAVAYTNSVGKPEKTAMYDIDSKLGLLQQTTPNDGVLATRGALGVTGTVYAFDIAATADLTNTAYLAAGGALHTVNLETGVATKTVDLAIEGDVRDIAILPAM
jgi:hypothetical protein